MKVLAIRPEQLVVSAALKRSATSKAFEERLKASIRQIGIAEPLKVAPLPRNKFLVVDGIMRLQAIKSIRQEDPAAFDVVPALQVNYDQRFELRYQTDIYQDLLPSQLAILVEHLHKTEGIRKNAIAGFIGVSPTTLRNYTGLWRLLQRGGLFRRLVHLMDAGVIPPSNPYAWLRLTSPGLRYVLEKFFADGQRAEQWIEDRTQKALLGQPQPFPIKFVEVVTSSLPARFYREGREVRSLKRKLGLRRAVHMKVTSPARALEHLARVAQRSKEPVLRLAARSLRLYLQR